MNRKEQRLTAVRLHAVLHYDPLTGAWTRLVSINGQQAGCAAGSFTKDGYLQIRIDGDRYRAHRLAVLYMTGQWPRDQVDHIDCDRANNRWANLRDATLQQNTHNRKRPSTNTSGYKGVFWHPQLKRWWARIRADGRYISLGTYVDPREAHAAYVAASARYHRKFGRAA